MRGFMGGCEASCDDAGLRVNLSKLLVIPSGARNLDVRRTEILRCAQDDRNGAAQDDKATWPLRMTTAFYSG
jgi:hypothetical protein